MAGLDFGLTITADGKTAVVEVDRVVKAVDGIKLASELAAVAAEKMQAAVAAAGRKASDEAGYRLAAAQQRDLAEQTRRRTAAAEAAAAASARLAASLRAEASAAAVKSLDSRAATGYADALAKVNAEQAKAAGAALLLERSTAQANAALARGQITQQQHAAVLREMTGAAQPAAAAAESVAGGLGKIGAAAIALVGVDRIRAMASGLIDAELAAQKLQRGLEFGAGSKTGGAAELEYIKRIASELGLEFSSAATAYSKFSASARGSALEGEGARKVFEAVAKASTVMSLSADESNGVFLALSQMMAKGKVSAEEFRGQLGERLPIATQVAAQALGVTTAEFAKMLDTGQLVAEDFLPKFAAALDKAVGPQAQEAAGALAGRINRLSTEWELLKRAVADQSSQEGRRSLIDDLATAMNKLRGLFTDDTWRAEIRETADLQRDFAAGTEQLTASGIKANETFVQGLMGAYRQGRISAQEAQAAFSAYSKRLVEIATEGKTQIIGLTADAARAQTKLVEQITREQERRTLSATDFAIREAEREAASRRDTAAGNAGLLELIESELQAKIKSIRDQAALDAAAKEKEIVDAAAKAAKEREDIERRAAGAIAGAYEAANAAKAGVGINSRVDGNRVVVNAGTPGEFVSSWDAAGNYVGDLGRFANGGFVRGPGSSTSDSIPARLSDGEYVVRAAAVSRVGVGLLDRINAAAAVPGFADGGMVRASHQIRSAQAVTEIGQVAIHLHGVQDVSALAAALQEHSRQSPGWLSSSLRRGG